MTKPRNDSPDKTRNVGAFIVQYRTPGSDRLWEFHSRDARLARKRAGQFLAERRLVDFKRHVGVGKWESLLPLEGGAS